MTWGGLAPSGQFATINIGSGVGSVDYEEARGDVSGIIDNLVVVGLQGRPISPLVPSSGDILKFDGSVWQYSTDSSGVSSHTLLSITHTDTSPASPSVGDIITGSGAPVNWVNFPIGLPHQSLRVSQSGNLIWRYDPIEIITSGTTVSLDQNTHRIVINKTVGSSTVINLPSSPFIGQEILVKDGKGDANMNNIRVFSPSGSTIDGLSEFRLRQKYQSMHFMYNGSDWNII